MKIDKLNCCVKSILSIFHDLTIYKGKSDIAVFWRKLNSTADEKTHPRETTDQQT